MTLTISAFADVDLTTRVLLLDDSDEVLWARQYPPPVLPRPQMTRAGALYNALIQALPKISLLEEAQGCSAMAIEVSSDSVANTLAFGEQTERYRSLIRTLLGYSVDLFPHRFEVFVLKNPSAKRYEVTPSSSPMYEELGISCLEDLI